MRKNINIGLCGFGAMGKVHSFAVNNLDFYYKDLPFSASIRGLCTTDVDRSKIISELYTNPVVYEFYKYSHKKH